MKRTPLKRITPLKRTKSLKLTSKKTAVRNSRWQKVCIARAEYLTQKYGHIICEYSGETVRVLSSVDNDLDDGWGHHIDHNRNHCEIENCMIVKYRYHSLIHDQNLTVKQEGFE